MINITNNRYLEINDTNVLKGLALIMLLTHHLFGYNTEFFTDILVGNSGICYKIGSLSNVCVALFVLLSGYGLVRQSHLKKQSTKEFYRHRLFKLMLNFWPIFIVFISIDAFVYGRTFYAVYHSDIVIRFLADFFGIISLFGIEGYNPTWWFLGCILLMYLLYPFLFKLLQCDILLLILISIGVSLIPLFPPPFDQLYYILTYLFSFVLGMVLAWKPINDTFVIGIAGGAFLIIIGLFDRLYSPANHIFFDGIIAVGMTALYFHLVKIIPTFFKKSLSYIGKHSMNIFLFHTFIYCFWFKDIVYHPRNPFLILLFFLSVCMVISIIIEKTKEITRYNDLVRHLS